MKSVIGKGAHKIIIQIGGIAYVYCDTKKAAEISGYSRSYVRQMCESGKLIATKKYGRWWVRLADSAEILVYSLPF